MEESAYKFNNCVVINLEQSDKTDPHTATSGEMRDLVTAARKVQLERFGSREGRYNAHMTSAEINRFCWVDAECEKLLDSKQDRESILKLARTVADIDASDQIEFQHVETALALR